MKRIAIYLIVFTLLSSCLSDEQYADYNVDPNNPTEVEADFLFNSALKNLADQMAEPNIFLNVSRMLSQYWATTTYPDESNYDFDFSNTPDNHWAAMYRSVFQDLTTAKEIVMADESLSEAQKSTRLAQAEHPRDLWLAKYGGHLWGCSVHGCTAFCMRPRNPFMMLLLQFMKT